MQSSNPVVWFEIYVNDMARAATFYSAVLGATLSDMPMPSAALTGMSMKAFPMQSTAYGAHGALVHMQGFEAGKNSTVVYFSCDDCAVEAARVDAAGGKIHQQKMNIGEFGFVALAYDTEGNMFGLHSMK